MLPVTTVQVRENHYREARQGRVVDAYGREVVIVVADPTYHSAGTGRRFASMGGSSISGTSAVTAHATTLRNRSHDLVRNNPWAWSGVDSFVSNAVGTGIKPQSQAPDPGYREAAHQLWTDWTDEADSDGVTDFYGLQTLATRVMVESGEAFLRLRPRRLEDGLAVPMQVQVLEPDHVPLHDFRTLPNGNRVRAGIEFDVLGRRVAYWMYRTHPGDRDFRVGNVDTVRVPAENVLHLFPITKQRAGQIRGEPWLARVILRLKDIDLYDDATLVRQNTAALFLGIVTTPDNGMPRVLGSDTPDTQGIATASMEPGTFQALNPGEDIRFSDPPNIAANEEAFINHELRGVAAGMGLTFEQLTGNLTGVNYSSIRAGILEFRRRLLAFIHQNLVYQFCRPVWNRVCREGVFLGALPAPGFVENPRPWLRATWNPQGWDWVDIKNEAMGKQLAMLLGLKTRSALVSEQGDDPEATDLQFAADQARADRLGLTFTSDGRRMVKIPSEG